MTTKDRLMRKLVTEDITDEKLEAAYMVLQGRDAKLTEEAPRGFLSVKDAQKYAGGISRSTLWNWVRQGLKTHHVGGRCLFLSKEIDEFILSRPPPSTKQEIHRVPP